MRNFEQRKAEVLHRSQVRIQRRKRCVHKVFVGCVLFFVCSFAVVAVLVGSSAIKPETNNEINGENDTTTDYSTVSSIMVQAGTENSTLDRVYQDQEQIVQIFNVIDSVTQQSSIEKNDASQDRNGFEEGGPNSSDGYPLLEITVTFVTGDFIRYQVDDNYFIDLQSGQRYFLTPQQWQDLSAVLLSNNYE